MCGVRNHTEPIGLPLAASLMKMSYCKLRPAPFNVLAYKCQSHFRLWLWEVTFILNQYLTVNSRTLAHTAYGFAQVTLPGSWPNNASRCHNASFLGAARGGSSVRSGWTYTIANFHQNRKQHVARSASLPSSATNVVVYGKGQARQGHTETSRQGDKENRATLLPTSIRAQPRANSAKICSRHPAAKP